ncbi:MAG: DUF58 domain-containing protein [bacterium]
MRVVPSSKLVIWSSFFLPLTLIVAIYPRILFFSLNWLLLVFCISGIDWIISRSFPEKIRIDLPSEISLIQNKTKGGYLSVTNSSRHNLSFRITFDCDTDLIITPSEIQGDIDTNTENILTMDLESEKRGKKHIYNVYLEVRSYLGFFLIRRKRKSDSMIKVYPNIFQDNQRLAASLFLRSDQGLRHQRIVGHGREFEQLRDYLPDDNFSDIAWKATAKKGKPITKIFQIERTQQIYIALDHSRSSHLAFGERSNLDVAIESILLMQLCCERMGDMLGLITFTDKISGFCPAGKGRTHFGVLRNLLYDLTPRPLTPDFENLFIFIKQRIRKRVFILLFTNIEDPGLASAFFNDVAIIRKSHLVTVCTFNGYEQNLLFSGDPVTKVSEIYKKLAAQISNNEQEKFASSLKKQNVDMLRFIPNKFAVGVIQHYLNVKRRQIL